MIELNYIKVKNFVYVYMLLPLLCFIALYLHSWLGGLFLVILYFLSVVKIKFMRAKKVKGEKKALPIYFEAPKSEYKIQVHIKYLVVFAIVAVVWSFLGGQGNLYYQSGDWDMRNAIYRDIVYRDWPVIYPDYDKALVYYIGYWLPAATITKVIGFIFPQIYLTEQAFAISNILLWIWTTVGVLLTELLLLTYAKPKRQCRILLIPVLIVFFSGMDIFGVIRDVIKWGQQFEGIHIEYWSYPLQFSCLTTCLFWVFNQTIIPWLAILCVLQEEKLQNYIFIGICTLAAGPIPMLGIAAYMFFSGIFKGIYSIVNRDIISFFKDVLSPVNCLGILILPVFLVFYTSNQLISNGISSTSTIFSVFEMATLTDDFLKEYLLFFLLEAGIYLFLLYRAYRNDIFYYITFMTALIAPLIKIVGSNDFVMRFSIPTIMVLAAFCLKYLVNYDISVNTSKINKFICIVLCACLVLGSVTPMTEFFRGYNAMLQTGKIANVSDYTKTLNQDASFSYFTVHDYKNSSYFKYFIREK